LVSLPPICGYEISEVFPDKMNKKKSPDDNEVLKDLDDYDEIPDPIETKPKKKWWLNFWNK
jgi:hypothetical protein